MSEDKFPTIDRRSAKRQKSKFTMRYTIQGETSPREAATVDVSSKSVLFEENQMLSVGTEIGMELLIPALPEPVEAEGRIIRIEEKERDQRYNACVLFDKISEEHQQSLEKYIQLIDVENLLKLAVEKK